MPEAAAGCVGAGVFESRSSFPSVVITFGLVSASIRKRTNQKGEEKQDKSGHHELGWRWAAKRLADVQQLK